MIEQISQLVRSALLWAIINRAALLSSLIVMAFTVPNATAQQNLPSMGEPADSALSPLEEKALGEQFMRQIRNQLPLVRDLLSEEYIQRLGDRLVAASGRGNTGDFTFFIINDPSINAFAIPGGYVGVNTGLIAAMAQEEQLASVLAHEIAHVTQRHHARAFATNNRSNLNTAAAILAAIVIGQASPEAGQAALAAGLAATQQSSINFTRNNEVEADRIGIEILDNANFDTRAMAETFDILRRQNSLNTSGLVLEYLRTHPLDVNRIAEAADRASNLPVRERQNALDFNFFKVRLDILTSRDRAQTTRQYTAFNASENNIGSIYAQAFAAQLDNRTTKARKHLELLDKNLSNNLFVALLNADINMLATPEAVDRQLAALAELYPQRYSIVDKQLEFLSSNNRIGEARQLATQYIRSAINPNPTAWRQLASIQQKLGDDAASHESLARYFAAIDELSRARNQLRLAIRQVATGSQDEIRLSASLKLLQQTDAARR